MTVETKIGMAYKTQHILQKADRYLPSGPTKKPCLLMFPGGGFTPALRSELLDHAPLATSWAQQGYCVFVVGYRGYGQGYTNRAPDTIADVQAALTWAKKESYVDKNKVLAWGGSAGGNLALWLGIAGAVKGVIAECPASDISSPEFEAALKGWLNNGPGEAYSPVRYVSAATSPAYLSHGTADVTVPYSHSVAYKAAMEAAGRTCTLYTHSGGHGLPNPYAECWAAQVAFAAGLVA